MAAINVDLEKFWNLVGKCFETETPKQKGEYCLELFRMIQDHPELNTKYPDILSKIKEVCYVMESLVTDSILNGDFDFELGSELIRLSQQISSHNN